MGGAIRICSVANCHYAAEGSIEDFAVCPLHDQPHTQAILERLERPGSYSVADGFPVVLPCGPLEEEHLRPKMIVPDGFYGTRCDDCPRLNALPPGHSKHAHPKFDLLRPWGE